MSLNRLLTSATAFWTVPGTAPPARRSRRAPRTRVSLHPSALRARTEDCWRARASKCVSEGYLRATLARRPETERALARARPPQSLEARLLHGARCLRGALGESETGSVRLQWVGWSIGGPPTNAGASSQSRSPRGVRALSKIASAGRARLTVLPRTSRRRVRRLGRDR
jgi:hypothetical protein